MNFCNVTPSPTRDAVCVCVCGGGGGEGALHIKETIRPPLTTLNGRSRLALTDAGVLLPSHLSASLTFLRLQPLVKFEVLTATSMKTAVFWDVAPGSLVDIDWRFRGVYCLHHQLNVEFQSLRRRQHVSAMRLYLSTRTCGLAAVNTVVF
jgi:hypothetical protein